MKVKRIIYLSQEEKRALRLALRERNRFIDRYRVARQAFACLMPSYINQP